MKRWENKQIGFTIVELLIVVVVIAILAVITVVAYNGIKERSVDSQVKSGLSQANKKVLAYAALNSDTYPATLADAGVSNADSVRYQYSSDNSATPKTYAVTASNGLTGSAVYYMTNTQQAITSGVAPGHNLVVWDKQDDLTSPVSSTTGVTVDTSVFRQSTASLRFSPSSVGKGLWITVSGNPGQVVTVKLWVKTDANWNGTGNNSKIRYGSLPAGNLLAACGYDGVKTNWTEITCPYTLNSTYSTASISLGNDGTVGNIWLDDISVSIK